jgi:DNA (cytosine-5)-methyltransferase 1
VKAVDLFAGPGGWDEGLLAHGIRPLGIEIDDDACATRAAAGHDTLQADIAKLEPLGFPCELLIASPPCPTFSVAGEGTGRDDMEMIMQCARNLSIGIDVRETMTAKISDPRSMLVVEPLRWALALRPRLIALEQVPPVLGLWKYYARVLEGLGYSTWAGVLNAADYGVPQTRERAFLIARLGDEPVHPPLPSHCRGGAFTIEGELLPWVSMADALGWGATARPYTTLAGGTAGGPCYDFTGGSGARKQLLKERGEGRWVVRTGRGSEQGGGAVVPYERSIDEPAPALDSKVGRGWRVWPHTEPSTTVAGDPRVSARCHHDAGSQGANAKTTEQVRAGDYEGTEPIRLTVAEASLLQSFRPDYPWQGTKTAIHVQIGNAVPPTMARLVVGSILGGVASTGGRDT